MLHGRKICYSITNEKQQDAERKKVVTMRYYAFHHTYGINTTDTQGNIIGALYVFDTKQERDEWVEKDVWDGNYHRSTVNSKDVRKYLEDMWFDFGLRNKADARHMSMENLVDRYTDWAREEYM